MRRAAIIGGGILTPLGNLKTTWQRLLAAESAVVCRQIGSLPPCPLAMIERLDGELGSGVRQQALFAHLQEELQPYLGNQPKTGLFIATTKAAVDELGHQQSEGQIWQIGRELGLRLGIEAAPVISAACASGLIAVIQGAMRIVSGELEQAVIIGYDLLSEFVVGGFASLRSLCADTPRPFDREGQISLGGWAVCCDAAHITAPSREGVGLQAVIRQLARQANMQLPLSIGGIIAHGTATLYNDAMELYVFEQLVQEKTPLCSVKGALGHSLAASGIIEVLLAWQSLKERVLPPTVGLQNAEESRCQLSGTAALPLAASSVLTTNSGFGGINAGLLLEQREKG